MSKDEIIAKLNENAKRSTGGKIKDRKYEILTTGDVNVKMSPQAITILKSMFELKKNIVSEQELFDMMNVPVMIEKLKTKQNPWKIFQYYRKTMVDAGFLKF